MRMVRFVLVRPVRWVIGILLLTLHLMQQRKSLLLTEAFFLRPKVIPIGSSIQTSSTNIRNKIKISRSRKEDQLYQFATTPSTSIPEEDASSNIPISSTTSEFDWKTEWYPLAPVQDLVKDEPNKLTILGMDLVIWYHEPSDSWKAFADVCPHRKVPLSEGRVEPSIGVIQCAYHGWEFDDNGSCVRIPQLQDPCDGQATKNERACVTKYPVRIEQGLLWVFPISDEKLASSKQPALIPELDDPTLVDATNFFVRDMPYSWDILVENLCDPAHVPFAHHEAMNNANRYQISQLDLKVIEKSAHGFRAEKDPYPKGKGRYDVKFEAPCLLYYTLVGEEAKSYIGLGTYCVPIAPGKSRIIARFPFKLPVKPAMFIIQHTPRWITHFSQNVVMDSDVVFLSSQDEYIKREGREKYYMPSQSDSMVSAFRTWLEQAPHKGPEWLGIPAERSDGEPTGWLRPMEVPLRGGRDALLDRYRQHTESCSSCRRAHRALYIIREACIVSGICMLAVAAAISSKGVGSSRKLFATIGATLLLTPQFILRPLIVRLECVPWPRKIWRQPTVLKKLTSRGKPGRRRL